MLSGGEIEVWPSCARQYVERVLCESRWNARQDNNTTDPSPSSIAPCRRPNRDATTLMSRELLRRCLKEEERMGMAPPAPVAVVARAVEDGGLRHNSVIHY